MTTIADVTALAAEQATNPAVPYVFGGTSLKGSEHPGVDCSGLPFACAEHFGVAIPRTSEEQYADLPEVAEGDLRCGDLVLYDVPGDDQAQPAHVAIWWNESLVLEAPHTGEDVMFSDPLPYGIMGYRRLPFPDADAPVPTPAPEPVDEPTIQLGSTGAPVAYAQALLTNKFNHPLAKDGDFGSLTEAAVKDVQKFFGVTVDGVVGPVTWQILVKL